MSSPSHTVNSHWLSILQIAVYVSMMLSPFVPPFPSYPPPAPPLGFPGNPVGKESAYNAGDPSSIPGSGRSPGEGIGYPLQCSWACLLAQLVKNPPAMWETWV